MILSSFPRTCFVETIGVPSHASKDQKRKKKEKEKKRKKKPLPEWFSPTIVPACCHCCHLDRVFCFFSMQEDAEDELFTRALQVLLTCSGLVCVSSVCPFADLRRSIAS
jgi:hypothetical protein